MVVGGGIRWRVIDKDEKTGEILITTSNAVGEKYKLSGAAGYIDIATNQGNTGLDTYCRGNYSADKGETNVRSMTLEDIEKLCSTYEITKIEDSSDNYAYYPRNAESTPNVSGEKNGKEILYIGKEHGEIGAGNYNDGIFLTYDVKDENGKITTYTATELKVGDGGYKILNPDEPVLVSYDYYYYEIPNEVKKLIGNEYSWLASVCVDTGEKYALFLVRSVGDGLVDAVALCDSCKDLSGNYAVRPVVSLSFKLLEQGSEGGAGAEGYNVWKLK